VKDKVTRCFYPLLIHHLTVEADWLTLIPISCNTHSYFSRQHW